MGGGRHSALLPVTAGQRPEEISQWHFGGLYKLLSPADAMVSPKYSSPYQGEDTGGVGFNRTFRIKNGGTLIAIRIPPF
jgi:hypothetical protein